MRFGYVGTAVHMEVLGGEKSMYASSRTKIPFQNDRVRDRSVWTEEGDICAPVGFPGDVTRINFIVGSDFNVDTIFVCKLYLVGSVLCQCPFARTSVVVEHQRYRLH